MNLRNWRFFIYNGFQNILRNRVMSLASVTAIMVALIVLGLMLVIVVNLDVMMKEMESKMEITLFLKDGVADSERFDLQNEISSWQGVYDVEFVSKHQALEEWKRQLGDRGSLLDGYTGENNPLPDSFLVKIEKPEYVNSIVEKAKAIPDIEEVNYSSKVAEFIEWLARTIRLVGMGLVAVLASVAVIIISNTVRLTVYSRRREIGIMKYIGATDWFIRWPFIIEGLILGVMGGIIATGVVVLGYKFLLDRSSYINARWGYLGIFKLLPLNEIALYILGATLLLGACVGVLASCLSIRKYLRV